MANLHDIKAKLYDNTLTPGTNDLVARVTSERTLDVPAICNSAVTRGGADISAAAMEHAVNLFHKEEAFSLCDGFSVNTGWYSAAVVIKGAFGLDGKFNPDKNTVMFEFRQGAKLRKELANVRVTITGRADVAACIFQVLDVKTSSINDLLTPGRNLHINGLKIKVAGDDAACGVYFINQDTQARTRVDDTDVAINKPSELMIIIPELDAGTYKVELVTQFSGHSKNLLKKPRTALFDRILTVA
jgi:hypothetical protein